MTLKSIINKYGEINVLFGSMSCKPYSIVRNARKKEGARSHDDARCVDAFWWIFDAVRPLTLVFEQVFGFALAESMLETESPLNVLLKTFPELFPEYAVCVFYQEGDVRLVFVRHRLYVVANRKSAGGQDSLEMLKVVVKDINEFRNS